MKEKRHRTQTFQPFLAHIFIKWRLAQTTSIAMFDCTNTTVRYSDSFDMKIIQEKNENKTRKTIFTHKSGPGARRTHHTTTDRQNSECRIITHPNMKRPVSFVP